MPHMAFANTQQDAIFSDLSEKKKQKNTKETILKTFTLYLRSSFSPFFFF